MRRGERERRGLCLRGRARQMLHALLPRLRKGLAGPSCLPLPAFGQGCSVFAGFAKPVVPKGRRVRPDLLLKPSSGGKGRRAGSNTAGSTAVYPGSGLGTNVFQPLRLWGRDRSPRQTPAGAHRRRQRGGWWSGLWGRAGLSHKHLRLINAGTQSWILLHPQPASDVLAQMLSSSISCCPLRVCVQLGQLPRRSVESKPSPSGIPHSLHHPSPLVLSSGEAGSSRTRWMQKNPPLPSRQLASGRSRAFVAGVLC